MGRVIVGRVIVGRVNGNRYILRDIVFVGLYCCNLQ